MKQTIRKITALLLAASLLCAFTACDEKDGKVQENHNAALTTTQAVTTAPNDDSGNTTNHPDTTDQSDDASPLEVLTAAIAKTKSAKSFVVNYGGVSGDEGIDSEMTVMMDAQGNYVSNRISESKYVYGDEIESETTSEYINGNTKYELGGYYFALNSDIIQYIAEDAYSAEEVFEDLYNNVMIITNDEFVKDFCSLEPTKVTVDNQSSEYTLKDLTLAQFFELCMGQSIGEMEMVGSADVILTVDKDGYFSGYMVTVTQTAEEMTETIKIHIAISQINQITQVEKPDWLKEVEQDMADGEDYPDVVMVYDGYTAAYEYRVVTSNSHWSPFDEDGYCLVSIEPDYKDEYGALPSQYTVLSELNGAKVVWAFFISEGFEGEEYVKKVVIPEGVGFGVQEEFTQYWSEAEIFFEKAAPDENDMFVFEDDENYSNDCVIKAAYYAGEWEYVDGVPTPKA
ncbi:MAG: hypothetical protein IJX76_10490 [Clostridia bacterium]|nr:hypothetical protein [Clostridia bacterium]